MCMHSTECFPVYCFITVLFVYDMMLEMMYFRAELIQLIVGQSDSELADSE